MINRYAILFCAILTVFTSGAFAQDGDITVEARVSDERATMGGGVLYTILVNGSIESSQPVLGEVDGFEVEYLGPMTSTQSTIVLKGGTPKQVRVIKTTHRYLITPTRVGAIKIPSASVVVNGQQYDTQPIWIESIRPQEMEDFKFTLKASSNDVYVNQPIAVRATWYVGASVQSFVWNAPKSDTFSIVLPPSTRSSAMPQGGNAVPVRIGREEVYGERGTETKAGRAFTTVSVDLIVIPTVPGDAIFGPMTIQFDRPVRSQNTFIRTTVNRREIIASNDITFNTKSPPRASVPVGYGGLVGSYDIAASISTNDVNVGDPIELTIQLVGDPFVMPGSAPDLSAIDTVTSGFKLSPDGWREEASGRSNERIYRTTIRAVNDDVDQVPPIVLHFFDPVTKLYESASSAALPLTVRQTREVTAADAIGVLATAAETASPLMSARSGLPANRTGPALLRNDHSDILAFATSPLGAAAIAGPAIVYGAIAVLTGVWRRESDDAHRRRRALSNARKQLKRGSDSSAAPLAIQRYIADKFSLQDKAITGIDCQSVLEPFDTEIAARFRAVLDAQETDSFGTPVAPPDIPLSTIRTDLGRLDRTLRKAAP